MTDDWLVVFRWEPGFADPPETPEDMVRQLDGATIRAREGLACVSARGKFLFVGGKRDPRKREEVATLLSHLARRMKAGRLRVLDAPRLVASRATTSPSLTSPDRDEK